MKNRLKALLAFLLATLCIVVCVSCEFPQQTPTPDEEEPGDQDVVEEVYKIKFVYSYTTVANNRVKKEVADVATVSVPVENTGLTDEHKAQINAITYNGYKFVEWYTEWDTNTQTPKGDPYVFGTDAVTADITLYGYRSNFAGPSVTWSLEEETYLNSKGNEETKMILTISGLGAMYDFENANDVDLPWYSSDNISKITDIVVDEGITHIGMNAFSGLAKAKNISLPSTLVTIGESAFAGDTSMTTFTAPQNLKSIGKNAFKGNTGLTKVYLNEGLISIADAAFYGAYSIKVVLVPSTLETIGVGAFSQGDGKTYTDHGLYKSGKVYYNVNADKCGCVDGHNSYTTTHLLDEYIDIGIDNECLVQYPPMYFYTEDEALGKTGSYWYTSAKTGEPMQYCYALKYYLPSGFGQATPIWVDYVPVTVLMNDNGEYTDAQGNVLEEGADPILRGQLTQANIDFADPTVRTFEGYKFASLGVPDTFVVGAYITGDVKYTCDRGNILSDGGGVIFSSTASSKVNGTVTVSVNPDASEGASYRIWDFSTIAATGALWAGGQNNMSRVTALVIGDGIEYIGSLAFTSLVSITEVVIPASVTEIHPDAFSACSGLLSIYYMGTDLDDCKGITELRGINAQVYARTETANVEDGGHWMDIDGKKLAWALSTDAETGARTLSVGGSSEMINFATPADAPWYDAKDDIVAVSFARNIRSLGTNVINGYTNVYSLSLPNDLKYIPRSAIDGTGIVTDTSSAKSQYANGMLVINNHVLRVDPAKRNAALFETPISAVTIAGGALSLCDKITAIYITNTIQYINGDAFDDTAITSIYIETSVENWNNVSIDLTLDESVTLYLKHSGSTPPADDGYYWQRDNAGNYTIYGCTHVWSDWNVVTAPTCKAAGLESRVCTKCDATVKRTVEKLSACVFGEYIRDERESCLDDYTETRTCKYCGDTETRDIPVTALKMHTFLTDDWVAYTEATCVDKATEIHYCQNEGCKHSETREIGELLPHIFGAYVYQNDATCYSNGHVLAHCERTPGCEATDSLEKPGTMYTEHDWQQIIASKYLCLKATVTTPDIYYMGCSHCDDVNTEQTYETKGSELKYYTYDADRLLDVANGGPIYTTDKGFVLDNNAPGKAVYAATVIQGVARMLEFGKIKGAADAGFALANSASVSSENAVHIVETKFWIGSFTPATENAYLFSVSLMGESEMFTIFFCDGGDGAVSIKTDLESDALVTVAADAVAQLRIEYFTEILGEEIVPEVAPVSEETEDPVVEYAYYNVIKLYIDGQSVELKAYLDGAEDASAANLTSVRFVTAETLTEGKFYIDDTYIVTVDYERAVAENNPNPATPDEEGDGEVTPPAEPVIPGKVEFDANAEPEDGVVTKPASTVTTTPIGTFLSSSVANGALTVNASSNPINLTSYTAFGITALSTTASCFVFEANLVVSSGSQQIVFADDSNDNRTFGIEIKVCTPEDGDAYVEIVELYGDNNVIATGLSTDGFTLRVELYKGAFEGVNVAKFFIDGAYVTVSDAVAYEGKKLADYDVTKVLFYHGRTTTAEGATVVVDSVIEISDVQVAALDQLYVPEIAVPVAEAPEAPEAN